MGFKQFTSLFSFVSVFSLIFFSPLSSILQRKSVLHKFTHTLTLFRIIYYGFISCCTEHTLIPSLSFSVHFGFTFFSVVIVELFLFKTWHLLSYISFALSKWVLVHYFVAVVRWKWPNFSQMALVLKHNFDKFQRINVFFFFCLFVTSVRTNTNNTAIKLEF